MANILANNITNETVYNIANVLASIMINEIADILVNNINNEIANNTASILTMNIISEIVNIRRTI